MTNAEISDVFSLLAKLMDIHNENNFKAKSYASAAFTIDKLPEQLSTADRHEIQFTRGIGESTAKKIIEILETGQLSQLNELIRKTPEGILEMLKIKGIGPKKIAVIWKELGIESPGELLYACNENRLIHYKGFGEKSQLSIREALEFYFSNQQRFLYAQLEPIEQLITPFLKTLFGEEQVAIAGDYACQADIADQLEYVIAADAHEIRHALGQVENMILKQEEEGKMVFLYHQAIPVHIYIAEEDNFGTVLFRQSGAQEFLQAFQDTYAIDLAQESFSTEEEIFEVAGIAPIPHFARHKKENIAASCDQIITVQDIKGVIHNHSTWSDGKNSIEEMARACIQKGYEYLVMSDHSVSSFYANGLNVDRVLKQQEEIDLLNQKLAPFKIFKSIECDILNDGRLDYDNHILATFDLVITSIHQNLKMTEEKAMERLLAAVSNPFTTILGHPTGRLLLSRKEYPVNHDVLIEACKKHQVAIEINANPRRLDVDWQWIQKAMQQNVLLSINPDAHSMNGIDDIRFGVLCAQKGLLRATSNVSSMNLAAFEQFIAKKKSP
ncbi:MAG: DNA polymerase/3'-5' exonuclease PolX [Chitinophagaceae bacterium]|nr:DNA polymerase/3'-5' exonuclease PolX [Chitinophagaceae bacterium]